MKKLDYPFQQSPLSFDAALIARVLPSMATTQARAETFLRDAGAHR